MNSPRFHLCLVAALAASDLSGCARLATSSAAPECRETVDDDGTLLKFCETDSRLTVELVAAAPQPLVGARPRLIDDPKVLAALRREALNKVSRKPPATPVALVCSPGVNEPAQSPSVSASLAPTPIIEDQAPTQVDDPAFAFTNRMN